MAIYKCSGNTRIDDDGNAACDYEATRPWSGRCPKCRKPYNCQRYGAERGPAKKQLTAADSQAPGVEHVYIPTGVGDFDKIIGPHNGKGGVVKSQSILLAGPQGSRKTSLALLLLQGLSKRTDRPLMVFSAEQNDHDLLAFCKLVGATSEQIKIYGNAGTIHDILAECDAKRPFASLFDSLNAIASNSGMTVEAVATLIARYGKSAASRGMISIIVSQMSGALNIKGGTGAPHIVDTLVTFMPFRSSIDGDPARLFGRKVAKKIGWTRTAKAEDDLPNLRLLTGGAEGKNRYGEINQRAYVWTNPEGQLVWLKKRSDEDADEDDDDEEPGPDLKLV